MTPEDALNMAKDYSALGWAVQEQSEEIIGCEGYPADMDELDEDGKLNINAVRMVKSWLEDYSEFIDDAELIADNIGAWLVSKKLNHA
jgi:hypothetical protein